MVEFPPKKRGHQPETSVVPEIWLLRSSKESWWPFHLKSAAVIDNAISKRLLPVGAGFKKTPFTKILRNYSEYPILWETLFWFVMGFSFVTIWNIKPKDLNSNDSKFPHILFP